MREALFGLLIATLGCSYPDASFEQGGDATLDGSDAGGDASGAEGGDTTTPPPDGRLDTPSDTCAANECGGCATLSGKLGEDCKAECGLGKLVCKGIDALECKPLSASNPCGGCVALSGKPGDPCTASCGPGTYSCSGVDALVCVPTKAPNECGGCATLTGKKGDACGPCGGGTLVCSGTEALACSGAKPTNVCGGCTTLIGAVGDPCGACKDGKLACVGADTLGCSGASTGGTMCSTGCTITDEDPLNCGACGVICSSDKECIKGVCTCPEASELCSGKCVPWGDAWNCKKLGGGVTCGATCDTFCEPSSGCVPSFVTSCGSGDITCPGPGAGHSCFWPSNNRWNCGSCGNACGAGQVCAGSACHDSKPALGCSSCPCSKCPAGWTCCKYGTHTYPTCVQGSACS